MLETVLGIPAHPLIVHAPVTFIPLLILGAVVYGLVPRVRWRIDWAVAALAVLAPVSAFFARQSGLALRSRLIREHGISPQDLLKIDMHQSYGTKTLIASCVVGVLTLALVGVQVSGHRPGGGRSTAPLSIGLAAVTIVASGFLGYYVFKTGDTGAHVVWEGR